MSSCLTYQSDTQHASLLRPSFSAMTNLISVTEAPDSEEKFKKFEKILHKHVIKGMILAGDRITIRQVLLEQIPKLAELLGIITVKYLQVGCVLRHL